MKVAVTSASGQLGKAVIKRAIEEFGTNNVIGLARSPEKAVRLGVEIRDGDYNKQFHFSDNLKDVEVLILLSGNDKPQKRIGQHRNVINGAKQAGVRKIVYASIMGELGKCAFDNIILSNRQTELDLADSGLEFAVSRNGLYIEADMEYVNHYIRAGKVVNSAAEGFCGYTSREELAEAYMHLVKNNELQGIYNIFGPKVTQQQLVEALNQVLQTQLVYEPVSVKEYQKDRTEAHGEYFGNIIAGIYEGIRNETFNVESDFEKVVGRKHDGLVEMIEKLAH